MGRALAVGMSVIATASLGCEDPTTLLWSGVVLRPAALDFGIVPTGREAVRTLVVSNPLPHTLELGSPHWVPRDAPFFVPAEAIVVPPSGEITLEVRFAPMGVGTHQASLVLADDEAHPLVVPVIGQGVERTLRLEGDGGCANAASESFGITRPGEVVRRVVRLVVEGPGTISIERAEVDGPFELATALPASASETEPLVVELSFLPQRSGQAIGRLELETSSGERARLDLCGRATRARLCVDPPRIDLGEVPGGDARTLSVGVRSCGEEEVTGLEARVVAGGALSIGAPPRLMPAGTSTTLAGQFVGADAGPWRDVIEVTADVPESPMVVEVVAEVVTKCDLEVLPAALSLAAVGATLPSLTHPVLIRNRAATPCELVEITSGTPDLFRTTADVEPPLSLLGGELFEVGVHLPQAYYRAFSDVLRIRARGDQTWPVAVHANTAPAGCEVLPRPQFVDFGFVAPGTTSTRTIALEVMALGHVCWWRTATLPSEASSGLSVETQEVEPRLTGSVVVTYAPTREEVLETHVELKVDGRLDPIRIPVRGEALAPRLEVEPAAIDFGPTIDTAERTIEVAAVGPEPVTLTHASFQPAHPELSLVDPLPVRLAPGQRRVLRVRYAPRDPFAERTSLVLWSDHRSRPHVIIAVTGRPADPVALEPGALYLERDLPGDGHRAILRFERPDAPPTEISGQVRGEGLQAPSISPDGRYVAFVAPAAPYPAPLLVRDLVEGTVRATTIVGAWSAVSWRPDVHTDPPHQFVYTAADHTLQIGTPEGLVRPLGAVDPRYVYLQPTWGPRGKIVFVRAPRAGAGGVIAYAPSDLAWIDEVGGPVTIVEGASGNAELREDPVFDPSGRWIAFSTRVGSAEAPFELRAVRVEGTAPSVSLAVSQRLRVRPRFPSWAPSGRLIAFVAVRSRDDPTDDDVFSAAFDPETGRAGPALRVDELSTIPQREGRLVWRP